MSDPSVQLEIDSQVDSQTDNQIVGLGEILWDVFPDGARFGGAPANFACSAAGLAAGSARVGMAFAAAGTADGAARTSMRLM
ncbi:MAG: hypothetical protein NTZ54_01880 [Alphaproteobacteria bacterium]|nr:hypothetical protein [Alphaproteobacteria bacterium]